jgi:hypothetical protein
MKKMHCDPLIRSGKDEFSFMAPHLGFLLQRIPLSSESQVLLKFSYIKIARFSLFQMFQNPERTFMPEQIRGFMTKDDFGTTFIL